MGMTFNTTPDITLPTQESDFIPNDSGGVENVEDLKPIDDQTLGVPVLEALGIDDSISNLSEEDRNNLGEVDTYIRDIIKNRDLTPTSKTFNSVLTDLKNEMGIDENTEPTKIVERIAGVIKGYRNLSFIKDTKERRRLFMQLARMENTKDMDSFVFNQMEKGEIWR